MAEIPRLITRPWRNLPLDAPESPRPSARRHWRSTEVVVWADDGRSDFNALRGRRGNDAAVHWR